MTKGEIVLVEFPYTDMKGSKVRPALVLAENKGDVLAAFITGNIKEFDEFDILLSANDKNKLKHDSKLRLFRLATIEKDTIVGRIGFVDESILQQINKNLVKILNIKL